MPVFPANFNVTSLNGVSGFSITGFPASSEGGNSVSGAGDVNGDGIADLVVGGPGAFSFSGASYVIFGRSGLGSSGSVSVASLTGSNGFSITGFPANSGGGYSVSGAGDVNNDGIADLVIGAPLVSSNTGVSYVLFGKSGLGSSGSLSLSGLTGSNGFAIVGFPEFSLGGASVSTAGDVNDDGIADLVIGAPYAFSLSNRAGASYVLFGKSGLGSSGSVNVSSLTGSNGFVITGFPAYSLGGTSVSGAGDVNADGIADLVIGVPYASGGTGASYVLFGKSSIGSSGIFNVSRLTGSNGFVISGFPASSEGGFRVSGAGDVNNDKIADLLIGAPYASSNTGVSYVLFGKSGLGSSGSVSVSSLIGTNGFAITGFPAGSEGGLSVSAAGDVNNDGIADLVVGAGFAFSNAGVSYVVFGQSGLGSSGSMSVASLTGSNGFAITGFPAGSEGGISVSGAGDINGDGIADLVVGALLASSGAGASYVIFGEPSSLKITKNSLSIQEGQTLILGSQYLNATAGKKTNSKIDLSLQFTLSSIQHGRFFVSSNPSVSLTSFLQQQVRSGQIQFVHDGSGWAPTYNVSVRYGIASTLFQTAQITFKQSFVLVNNQLTINRGQTVILTTSDLSANDLYNTANNPNLIFSMSNVQHGYFALISAPTTPVTSFTQAQIQSGDVQFVHDGTITPPRFNSTVIDGTAKTASQRATISFDIPPVLTKNRLTVYQNQTVVFTLNNLNATDPYTTSFDFAPSAVKHGYFSLKTMPFTPISSFTQTQIQNGLVQFSHDGSVSPPSYNVTVSDGRMSSSSQAAVITFDIPPAIIANTLTINQGQTVVLSSSNLSASDPYSSNFTFTVYNVKHGFFALVTAPSIEIISFSQVQVQSGQLQFVHDGGVNPPSYSVAVDDGRLSSSVQAATISFDVAPSFVANTLTINQGQTVVVGLSDLSATDPFSSNFTFTISNIHYGFFALVSAPTMPITSFTQTQIQVGQVQFVHNGSMNPPSYDVSVSDGRMTSGVQACVISFYPTLMLTHNALTLDAGQSIVFTSLNLNVTALDGSSPSQIIFTVADVTGGYFAYIDYPTSPILSFSQADINSGQVEFISNGSNYSPTYSIAVSDGIVIVDPVPATITFGNAPQILVNQITISQSGTQLLNLNHLHATAPGATNSTLLFLVDDVHHGQFEVYGQSGTLIGNFTQQQLINGNIQFVQDGSNDAPGYSLTAFNLAGFSGLRAKRVFRLSSLSAAPSIGYYSVASSAKIWFQAGGITLPQLKYNRLYIVQGGKMILGLQELLAVDMQGSPVFNATFLINSLTHGKFISVLSPQISYLNFSQSQVFAGEIQFIHDGSTNVPSYQVIVNQGPYFSAPYSASIAFRPIYSPPKIIGQLPNQTITVDEAFSFSLATSAFSDTTPLHFLVSSVGGSQLPSWIHFDNVTNYFSGIATTPGITPIQITAKDAAHLTASTFFFLKAQSQPQPEPQPQPQIQSHTSSSGAIIGGVVGGVIGLMLLVMRCYIGRQAQTTLQKAADDEATQKITRLLAKEIFEKVKLTGCCGHLSEINAKAYIKAIENIVSKLDLVNKAQPLTWIDEIANQIKKQANKSYCYSFFKPEITPQELSDKAETIAQSVQHVLSAGVGESTPRSDDVEMSGVMVLSA